MPPLKLKDNRLMPEELNTLIEVSKILNSTLKLHDLLNLVMKYATQVMRAEASSVLLIDPATQELVFEVSLGEKAEQVKTFRLNKDEGIAGWVVREGKSVIVEDVKQDPRFSRRVDEYVKFETKSILAVPLKSKGEIIGVIEIINKLSPHQFNDDDMRLCEAFASHAAIAIENARLHEESLKTARLAGIGEAMSGIAHCIKNILNGIQGGSYILDQGAVKRDWNVIVKGWEMLKRNIERMKHLAMDMLLYSKKREPEYEEAVLNRVVEEVYELMREYALQHKVELGLHLDASLSTSIFDPKGIHRCLMNLLGNAIDACRGNSGRVVLSTQNILDKNFVRIIVSDNGPGIPEEDKKRLFRTFYSTKGSGGTGLGLAITYKIIKEHGGDIHVESESGKGTTFIIDLPVDKR